MSVPRRLVHACLIAAVVIGSTVAGDAPSDPAALKFFDAEVKPILIASCLKCHGGEAKIKGGLRMTTREAVVEGGDTGPAVDLAKPDISLLLKMVNWTDDDHQMPPKEKLAQAKIDVLAKWVKLGLPMQGDLGPTPEALAAAKLKAEEAAKNFWAYKKPVEVALPAVKDAKWVRQPLDALVLAALEAKGLKPVAEADRRTLIRRATYDLIGLPPSPEEVEAFVKDTDPKAYDKLLDRLLASPQYGEKWGRYWLDLVHFAETNGYERDGDKPNAWRYRDYVVKAFNEDKPYDQFVREQLAGDQLDQPTADSITATGFYRLGLWDDEPADRELAHYDYFDSIVSTTSQAFLAMQMGCARCHDHKRDPISQEDYYRMLAFFHGIKSHQSNGPDIETVIARDDKVRGEWDTKIKDLQGKVDGIEEQFRAKAGGDVSVRDIEELTYKYYRGAWENLPDFDQIKAESEGKLPKGLIDTAPTTRDSDFGFVWSGTLVVPADGRYTFVLDSDDGSRLTIGGKQVALNDGIHGTGKPVTGGAELKKGRVPLRLDYFQHVGGRGLGLTWAGPGGVNGRVLTSDKAAVPLSDLIEARGKDVLGKEGFTAWRDTRRTLEKLKKDPPGEQKALSAVEGGMRDTFVLGRGMPANKGKKVEPGFPHILGFPEPPSGGERRLTLANWIVSADNPLGARVMVNRLWQFHFGKGIVPSANDYGRLGTMPTNQALLDWLATRFIKDGWSVKTMHRLLMTSSTYRLAYQVDAADLAKDPENELNWRFSMRRLTGEEIRDSLLSMAGVLNPTMGGPSVFPPMPAEVLATSSQPNNVWGKSSVDDARRRSIYIKVKRSLLYPILAAHDQADTDSSCPMRFATIVPTQALTMLNSSLMGEQSALFAQRLVAQAGSDPAKQVRLALSLATQREPKEKEIARGVSFIRDLQQKDNFTADRSLQMFCLMVLNLNEFAYLD